MLGEIARQLGVTFEQTLTGFKWIALRARELGAEGKRFVFGYEEALGYAVGDLVHDKDGISAAALMAELGGLRQARVEQLVRHRRRSRGAADTDDERTV